MATSSWPRSAWPTDIFSLILSSDSLLTFGLAGLLLFVAFVLGRLVFRQFFRSRGKNSRDLLSALPKTTAVAPRPVLLREEGLLYNLIKLSVEDQYLVLAKLPALSLVTITEDETTTRQAVVRTIARVRLDVVLIHPGTLLPDKVLMFLSDSDEAIRSKARNLVKEVLEAAGIQVVPLDLKHQYTVTELVRLLGLEEEA